MDFTFPRAPGVTGEIGGASTAMASARWWLQQARWANAKRRPGEAAKALAIAKSSRECAARIFAFERRG